VHADLFNCIPSFLSPGQHITEMIIPSTIWGIYLLSLSKFAVYDMNPKAGGHPTVNSILAPLREDPQLAGYIEFYKLDSNLEFVLQETERTLRKPGDPFSSIPLSEISCSIAPQATKTQVGRKLMLRAAGKLATFAGKAVGAGVGVLMTCLFGPASVAPPIFSQSSNLLKLKPPKAKGLFDPGLTVLLEPPSLPTSAVADDWDELDTDVGDDGPEDWDGEDLEEEDSDDYVEVEAMSDEEMAEAHRNIWLQARKLKRGIESISPLELTRVPVQHISTTTILSKLSYHTVEEMRAAGEADIINLLRDQSPGFPIFVDGDPEFDTKAYVWLSRSRRTLFVAFRGTHSFTDVIHDLDYRMLELDDEHPGVGVHSGFRNKFKSIEDELLDVTLAHEEAFDKIVVTGHSLGGAIATVASPIIAEAHPTKTIDCMTFGSPRVGNELFKEWFNANVDLSLRIVNDFDPIQSIPWEGYYHHVGHAISLSETGEVSKVPEAPVDKRFWNALEDLDFDRFLRDHRMNTYIVRINSILKKHN
jgi:hypothetical protein